MNLYAKFSDIKENKFDPNEQDFYDSYSLNDVDRSIFFQ